MVEGEEAEEEEEEEEEAEEEAEVAAGAGEEEEVGAGVGVGVGVEDEVVDEAAPSVAITVRAAAAANVPSSSTRNNSLSNRMHAQPLTAYKTARTPIDTRHSPPKR